MELVALLGVAVLGIAVLASVVPSGTPRLPVRVWGTALVLLVIVVMCYLGRETS